MGGLVLVGVAGSVRRIIDRLCACVNTVRSRERRFTTILPTILNFLAESRELYNQFRENYLL